MASLNFNKVVLAGGLTKDPVVSNTESGSVVRTTLGVARSFKKEGEQYPESDYVNITAFGKTGERLEKYFKKGSGIMVEGQWRTGSYTNKDGQKVYTNELIADRVYFVDKKSSDAPSGAPQEAPAAAEGGADMGDFTDYPDMGELPW